MPATVYDKAPSIPEGSPKVYVTIVSAIEDAGGNKEPVSLLLDLSSSRVPNHLTRTSRMKTVIGCLSKSRRMRTYLASERDQSH